MINWFKKRKELREKELYKMGYDWAAGSLLRGEITPAYIESLWWGNSYANEYHWGAQAAADKLIELKVIEDDTVSWV